MDLRQFANISKIWFVSHNKLFFAVMTMNTESFCEELNSKGFRSLRTRHGTGISFLTVTCFFIVYNTMLITKMGKQFITCCKVFLHFNSVEKNTTSNPIVLNYNSTKWQLFYSGKRGSHNYQGRQMMSIHYISLVTK